MIRLWDVAAAKLRSRLEGHEGLVRSLALSRPMAKLLASSGRDGALNIWELASGKVVATMQEGVLGFQAVVFTLDGKSLATGGIDRNVTLVGCELDAQDQKNRPRRARLAATRSVAGSLHPR